MHWINVESSNIERVGFDPEKNDLFVKFLSGGTYSYADVDEDIFDNFVRAESKGKYFLDYVKPDYIHTRLDEEKS